jgi:hypothetical protein
MQLAGWLALSLVLLQTNLVTQNALGPRFDYSASLGCGDVFFHAMNSAKTEVLRIEVDFARNPGSGSEQVFDLAALPTGVVVDITLYQHPQINRPNCDDVKLTEVGAPPNPPQVWLPTGGRLEIERGPKGVRPEEPWLFKTSIRLRGVSFRGPNGRVVSMSQPFTWEGFVGWQAG